MKAGDRVAWESQAAGSWTKKEGTVIAEIPAGEIASKHLPEVPRKSHVKFDAISKRNRVLVAVPAGKNGQITHYYCPPASLVRLVPKVKM